jgi:hypothetical protein
MTLPRTVFRLDLYGPHGALEFDAVAVAHEEPWPLARRTFAEAVRTGRSPALDVHRGLMLQRLVDAALVALAT